MTPEQEKEAKARELLGRFVRCKSHRGECVVGRIVDVRADRGLVLVAWPTDAHSVDKLYTSLDLVEFVNPEMGLTAKAVASGENAEFERGNVPAGKRVPQAG